MAIIAQVDIHDSVLAVSRETQFFLSLLVRLYCREAAVAQPVQIPLRFTATMIPPATTGTVATKPTVADAAAGARVANQYLT